MRHERIQLKNGTSAPRAARLKTGAIVLATILAGITLAMGSNVEARRKSPSVGGGCTAARLQQMHDEDRIAYDWCAAKIDQSIISGQGGWHFECDGSGIYCCPDGDGQCQWLARPAPQNMPSAPIMRRGVEGKEAANEVPESSGSSEQPSETKAQ